MMFKKAFLVFVIILSGFSFSYAQVKNNSAQSEEADQQISDFSLAGYGEKGKKTWDLAGKSADIFDNIIKLKDLIGNMYGDKETVKLTADRGDFDKANGKIHVEKNVVITTSSGARLTTDSLDWDRVNQSVSTDAVVNIEKESMFTTARGARGRPNLNQMSLQKEVMVEINPQSTKDNSDPASQDKKEQIVITCEGPLDIDYEKNVAVFNNNVKVDRQDSQIYSDTMEVYFGSMKSDGSEPAKEATSAFMGAKINKIVAKGNVRTIRGSNVTYSEVATYDGIEKKLTLSGRPKLLIFSTEDFKGLPIAK